MDAKARLIEQMIGKLRKRALELEKDASRLALINKTSAASAAKALREAAHQLQLAIGDLVL